MGHGSHVILMSLWARKETTKHMVRVHADGSDTVSTWMFRMEEPSAFHTVYKSFDLVSVLCPDCALANPHHVGDAYVYMVLQGQSGGLGDEVERVCRYPL